MNASSAHGAARLRSTTAHLAACPRRAVNTHVVNPEPNPHNRQITILLIEDDKPIREPMKQMLARHAYGVLAAADAEEALLLWNGYRRASGAVVSDCDLVGGRTGLSLPQEFAGSSPTRVFVLASGSLTPELVSKLERTTPIKCLPKPFSFSELLRLLPDVDGPRR